MEQSAFDALFIGVFVIIFVVALSTTIFLFREIIDYSDEIFDASNKFVGESVLVLEGVDSTNENNIIRGVDALAYVTNYGCYSSNSTYQFSRKYGENKDLKIRIKLKNLNNNITTHVDINGYYKLNMIKQNLNSITTVELKQLTAAQAGV